MSDQMTDEAWGLLHEVRLRGFVASTGKPPETDLLLAGYIVVRGPNIGLTPGGREAHTAWARLAEGSAEEAGARAAYDRFLPLNTELLKVCTAWQLLPDGSINDHSDRAYDFSVLERLDRLHERVTPWLARLADAVPRFGGYAGRLEAALDKVADDRQWLASPRCDSYHTVWMQMHEDLLGAVGAARADEPEPQ
ncbi:MAG: MarR family transcriptional regulator [Acidimicrobiia bacterium]